MRSCRDALLPPRRTICLESLSANHRFIRPSKRILAHPFDPGVEIFEYLPGLLHAKTVVIDGEWATIGSTNFDNRSFALNEEVNATIYDRGTARRLERDFAEDLRYARQVSYEAWRHRGLITRAREVLTRPIRSQM